MDLRVSFFIYFCCCGCAADLNIVTCALYGHCVCVCVYFRAACCVVEATRRLVSPFALLQFNCIIFFIILLNPYNKAPMMRTAQKSCLPYRFVYLCNIVQLASRSTTHNKEVPTESVSSSARPSRDLIGKKLFFFSSEHKCVLLFGL